MFLLFHSFAAMQSCCKEYCASSFLGKPFAYTAKLITDPGRQRGMSPLYPTWRARGSAFPTIFAGTGGSVVHGGFGKPSFGTGASSPLKLSASGGAAKVCRASPCVRFSSSSMRFCFCVGSSNLGGSCETPGCVSITGAPPRAFPMVSGVLMLKTKTVDAELNDILSDIWDGGGGPVVSPVVPHQGMLQSGVPSLRVEGLQVDVRRNRVWSMEKSERTAGV